MSENQKDREEATNLRRSDNKCTIECKLKD